MTDADVMVGLWSPWVKLSEADFTRLYRVCQCSSDDNRPRAYDNAGLLRLGLHFAV